MRDLANVQSFEEWTRITKELDLLDVDSYIWKVNDLSWRSPHEENKEEKTSAMKTALGFEKHKNKFYDNFKVMAKRKLLRGLRHRNDIQQLMHVLRQDLVKNLYGIGSVQLYNSCYNGTKENIEWYHNELIKAIEYVYYYQGNQLSQTDKLEFFQQV